MITAAPILGGYSIGRSTSLNNLNVVSDPFDFLFIHHSAGW